MCLSKVYLREKGKDKIVFEEATNIIDKDGTIEVHTIFGEKKELHGCYIKEINFFDKTPLLDIKPYIKDLDSKSDANYGWVADIDDYKHLLLHIKGIPHTY